jgi:hypothetical protein
MYVQLQFTAINGYSLAWGTCTHGQREGCMRVVLPFLRGLGILMRRRMRVTGRLMRHCILS